MCGACLKSHGSSSLLAMACCCECHTGDGKITHEMLVDTYNRILKRDSIEPAPLSNWSLSGLADLITHQIQSLPEPAECEWCLRIKPCNCGEVFGRDEQGFSLGCQCTCGKCMDEWPSASSQPEGLE